MTDRERLLERALLCIEGMTVELADNEPENRLYGDIYSIAHAATGRCCTGGASDWLNTILEPQIRILKELKLIDVDAIQVERTS